MSLKVKEMALLGAVMVLMYVFLVVMWFGGVDRGSGLLGGLVVVFGLGGMVAGGVMVWLMLRAGRELEKVLDVMGRVADGDLTVRVRALGGRSECGRLGIALDGIIGMMERLMRVIGMHAGNVTASATELVRIREQIEADAGSTFQVVTDVSRANDELGQAVTTVKGSIDRMSENVRAISDAATEVSNDVVAIAASVEQASANITTMASAAEEITANIGGINGNLNQVDEAVQGVANSLQGMTDALGGVRTRCQEANVLSEQANEKAQGARVVMENLGVAAREIGQVVELINNIADQTNMLALNASIEAAGAGEAGKGFAVVANEVKELARQTAQATRLIADRIDEIQSVVNDAVETNREIGRAIERINTANQEITASVDEQNSTIRVISGNMNAVADAAGEVTNSAKELNYAAAEVARAAAEAAQGTQEVANSAGRVANLARQVAEESHRAMEFAGNVAHSAQVSQEVSLTVQGKMEEASRTTHLMQGSARHFQRLGQVMQNMSNSLYASQTELDIAAPPFNIMRVKEELLSLQGHMEQLVSGRIGKEQAMAVAVAGAALREWLRGKEGLSAVHREANGEFVELMKLMEVVERQVGAGEEALETLGEFHERRESLFRLLNKLYQEEGEGTLVKPFFPWGERLMTGIEFVDREHKVLVDMINALQLAMKEGRGTDVIGKILDGLVDYTRTHFAHEEEAMARTDYPAIVEHKAKHVRLVATLQDLVRQFREGRFSVGIDLLGIAKVWLVEHILGTDLTYVPYMRAKNIH
ncbi:MAG: bacteriohemerythrin [Magnetococcales bacterium]|nr:bacteriohemerythrin [Magnetococcales bacterium]